MSVVWSVKHLNKIYFCNARNNMCGDEQIKYLTRHTTKTIPDNSCECVRYSLFGKRPLLFAWCATKPQIGRERAVLNPCCNSDFSIDHLFFDNGYHQTSMIVTCFYVRKYLYLMMVYNYSCFTTYPNPENSPCSDITLLQVAKDFQSFADV